MNKVWDLKVHVDGRHTLLLHQSVMCAFSGRLRAMATRETKAKSGGGAEAASMCVDLAGFPGGGEGFDLVAQFCYSNGRLPPLRPSDLPLVHCAAAFLEMTEEVRAGNLLAQEEAFVDVGLCYWSWADVLAAVKSCEAFGADVSGLRAKLLSVLFSRIAQGAETSNSSSSSSPETAGGSSGRPSSAKTPESVKRSCLGGGREWWFDDVASLSQCFK